MGTTSDDDNNTEKKGDLERKKIKERDDIEDCSSESEGENSDSSSDDQEQTEKTESNDCTVVDEKTQVHDKVQDANDTVLASEVKHLQEEDVKLATEVVSFAPASSGLLRRSCGLLGSPSQNLEQISLPNIQPIIAEQHMHHDSDSALQKTKIQPTLSNHAAKKEEEEGGVAEKITEKKDKNSSGLDIVAVSINPEVAEKKTTIDPKAVVLSSKVTLPEELVFKSRCLKRRRFVQYVATPELQQPTPILAPALAPGSDPSLGSAPSLPPLLAQSHVSKSADILGPVLSVVMLPSSQTTKSSELAQKEKEPESPQIAHASPQINTVSADVPLEMKVCATTNTFTSEGRTAVILPTTSITQSVKTQALPENVASTKPTKATSLTQPPFFPRAAFCWEY